MIYTYLFEDIEAQGHILANLSATVVSSILIPSMDRLWPTTNELKALVELSLLFKRLSFL